VCRGTLLQIQGLKTSQTIETHVLLFLENNNVLDSPIGRGLQIYEMFTSSKITIHIGQMSKLPRMWSLLAVSPGGRSSIESNVYDNNSYRRLYAHVFQRSLSRDAQRKKKNRSRDTLRLRRISDERTICTVYTWRGRRRQITTERKSGNSGATERRHALRVRCCYRSTPSGGTSPWHVAYSFFSTRRRVQ